MPRDTAAADMPLTPDGLSSRSLDRGPTGAAPCSPGWRRLVSKDLAIDLGTTNTRLFVAGRGVVVDEPSVIAVDVNSRRVRAMGREAKRALGRTPASIRAVCPIRAGLIADLEMAEAMLRLFIARASRPRGILQPRVMIAVPSGTTAVERRAIRHAAELAGAREVYLIEKAVAAALGAGLPIEAPRGSFVVDVGGGTTEAAVLALGGTVHGRGTAVGGGALDDAIVLHMKRKHNLLIGPNTAEAVKLAIGTAVPRDEPRKHLVRGRDLLRRAPHAVEVSCEEIRDALDEPLGAIARVVADVLEACPPELVGDVMDSGVVLTGGGALLPGLDAMLAGSTGLPVVVADQPLLAVVAGCGRCLASVPFLRRHDGVPGALMEDRR